MTTLNNLNSNIKKNTSTNANTLNGLTKAVSNFNVIPMTRGIEAIKERFSAMGIAGMTVIARLTNSFLNFATRTLRQFTIQPILDGFNEYETQMRAIQTILSNTASKGTTLDQVNASLDELNHYADTTIYNFSEMTRNIGTFTAAGVDLQTSVNSIKGIANLAAMSGSTSQQASVAMYQLSQAIASGTVRLMDWNSVVNAGMGGEVFQEALKRTARHFGVNVDAMIEKYGSFRESLSRGGWLTSQILTETLTQISGAYTEADLISQGYTEDEARAITQLAQNATDAATKVKTLSQLIQTTGEALGSGWASTWRIIFGDFQEASDLFTSISDKTNAMIQASADARNELLQGWKDLGGRDKLIDALSTAFENLEKVLGTLHDAFRDVFPPATSQQLYDLTSGFDDLMHALTPSAEALDRLGRIAHGVFSAISLVGQAIGEVAQAVWHLVSPIVDAVLSLLIPGLDTLTSGMASLGDFLTALDNGSTSFDTFGNKARKAGEPLNTFISILDTFSNTLNTMVAALKTGASTSDILKAAIGALAGVIGIKTAIAIQGFIDSVKSFARAFNVKEWIDRLKSLREEGEKMAKSEAPTGIVGNIKMVLGSLKDSLNAFTTAIKGATLIEIAAAIGILTISIVKLSQIDPAGLVQATAAIGILMKMLTTAFNSLSGEKGIVRAGLSMILVATAVNILYRAVAQFASMNLGQLIAGLTGAAVSMLILSKGMKSMLKALDTFEPKGLIKSSVALILLATALNIMAMAMQKFATMSFGDIVKSLIACAGALSELTIVVAMLSKYSSGGKALAGATSILILSVALDKIYRAFSHFGSMDWASIGRATVGMGAALGEVSASMMALSKLSGGIHNILDAVAIDIFVESLQKIYDAFSQFSTMDWASIERGATGMGAALGEVSGSMIALSRLSGGIHNLLDAEAIKKISKSLDAIYDAFSKFGSMDWAAIGRAATGMGVALGEVSASMVALSKLSGGIHNLLDAEAIKVLSKSLDAIYDSFSDFGSMDWDSIGRASAGMAIALGEVDVAVAALGKFGSLSAILGSMSITMVTEQLGNLYDAFSKFGTMDWDSIGRAVVAMGAALLELAGGTFVAGLAGFAGLVGSGSIALAAQGLPELADAFAKFGELDWGNIGQAATAMGAALGETALGGLINTFSGIGAGNIKTAAEGLNGLADTVKKWIGVKVDPAFGSNMQTVAAGVTAFNFAGWGADAIASMAEALGTLADSVQRWSGVTIPDGLVSSLRELSGGIMSFTLTGLGAFSIATVAGPLGTMAESVKAWSEVTLPENLVGDNGTLAQLARGIGAFSGYFLSGLVMGTMTEPLRDMASAVQAWAGVTIPPDLVGDNGSLAQLATALGHFSGIFMGGFVLATMTGPLRDLAGSVSAWNGVTIPSELVGDNGTLAQLATALGHFSFLFIAGGSLSTITGPLKDLANSVGAWKSVSIPEKLIGDGGTLAGLATALGHFTFAFTYAGQLGDLANSLKPFGDAVRKFSGLKIPSDISDGMQHLADALGKFSDVHVDNAGDIKKAADAISKFSNVVLFTDSLDLPGKIQNLINGFNNMPSLNTGRFVTLHSAIQTTVLVDIPFLVSALNNIPDTGAAGLKVMTSFALGLTIGSGLAIVAAQAVSRKVVAGLMVASVMAMKPGISMGNMFTVGLNLGASRAFAAASAIGRQAVAALGVAALGGFAPGLHMAQSFASGIHGGSGSVVSAVSVMINSAVSAMNSGSGRGGSAGRSLANGFAAGIGSGAWPASAAASRIAASAVAGIGNHYSQFYNAGANLALGFARGISANAHQAVLASTSMARAASNAVNKYLIVGSPSKRLYKTGRFMVEGFTNALRDGNHSSMVAGRSLAQNAVDGFATAIEQLNDIAQNDLDTQPTITPVIDLTNVRRGVGDIDSMVAGSYGLDAFNAINGNTALAMQPMLDMNSRVDDIQSLMRQLTTAMSTNQGQTTNVYFDGAVLNDDERIQADVLDILTTLAQRGRLNNGR